jgi:hypothetical protein
MKPLNQMLGKDFSSFPILLALQNENMYYQGIWLK